MILKSTMDGAQMETKEHLEFEMESRNFLNVFRKKSKVNSLYKFEKGYSGRLQDA